MVGVTSYSPANSTASPRRVAGQPYGNGSLSGGVGSATLSDVSGGDLLPPPSSLSSSAPSSTAPCLILVGSADQPMFRRVKLPSTGLTLGRESVAALNLSLDDSRLSRQQVHVSFTGVPASSTGGSAGPGARGASPQPDRRDVLPGRSRTVLPVVVSARVLGRNPSCVMRVGVTTVTDIVHSGECVELRDGDLLSLLADADCRAVFRVSIPE